MIWGTMAPISWVAAPPSLGTWTFGLMTLGAAAGIAKTIRWPNLPKRVSALIYVLFACLLLPTVPSVAEKSGAWGAVLLLFGGVLFAIGALIYSKRSPNPIPGVLGYHEVFHLLVIAAAACQYVTVWRILDP